jgi:hypothetical protein
MSRRASICLCAVALVVALVSAARAEPPTPAPTPAPTGRSVLAALKHGLKHGLNAVRKRASRTLRLDEAVLELSGTVATGKRGWWSLEASPKLILSGSKTGNRPTQFAMAPAVNGQAYVATAGVAYIPGFERPIARTFGVGPFTYRPHDPIHNSPFVGLSIPLIGSVVIGPKMIGASRIAPLPFAPVVSAGGGVYFSHPWLEPITGRLWNLGVWAVGKAKPIGIKARARARELLRAHPRIGRAVGHLRTLSAKLVSKGKPIAKAVRRRVSGWVEAGRPRVERVTRRLRRLVSRRARPKTTPSRQ